MAGRLPRRSQNAGDSKERRFGFGYEDPGAFFRGWQFGANAFRHDDQAGRSLFDSGEIFLVSDEGEMAAAAFQDLDVVNFDVGVSLELSVQNVSDFPGRQGLSRRCCRHQALRSLLAPELTATRPPYGQENNRRAVQRVGEVGRMLAKTGILTQDGLPDGGGERVVGGNGAADRSGFWD